MDRLELENAEIFESNAAPRCHSPAEPWPWSNVTIRWSPSGPSPGAFRRMVTGPS